jgi:hypothetical protein
MSRKKKRPFTVPALRRAAETAGATIFYVPPRSGDEIPRHYCYVDAPPGKVWADSFVHTLVIWWAHGRGKVALADKQAALNDGIMRIVAGLEECGDPECDICCPRVPECAGCGVATEDLLGGLCGDCCKNRESAAWSPDGERESA